MTTPLSILDLSPFGTGQTSGDGLRATIALAQRAEKLGYARYWLAEHHLNPGISGSAPHVLLAAIAAVTSRIRIGTAATIIGNYAPLQVAEAAGTVAALHPGRFDLGIGRSGAGRSGQTTPPPVAVEERVVEGVLLPKPSPFAFEGDRFTVQARLLRRGEGDADRFPQDVRDILALIDGTYAPPEGVPVHATPAEGADLEVWVHGSTAGASAQLAGELGLPFGSNYHVASPFVIDAVAAYRAAFRPGRIPEPRVIVSADVLVADTEGEARRIGEGYGHWVHSIRARQGAIAYPTPEEARAHPLSPEEEALVRDRLDTRFVGAPEQVAGKLRTLQRATDADELLVTTIAHDPAARERSFALLAEAWGLEDRIREGKDER